MFKTLKAIWNVVTNNDVNSTKPVKVKKPSKEEMDERRAMLQKEKEAATARGEPWVGMITMNVDYNNLVRGNFELDWNDKFLARCMKAGYVGKTDADVIDQWFTNVCRNVVMETYEQVKADPSNRSIDLGDGFKSYE